MQRKTLLLRAAATCAAFGALAVLGLSLAAWITLGPRFSGDAEPDPVQIPIGAGYEIPRAFLSSATLDKPAEYRAVLMEIRWPELRPRKGQKHRDVHHDVNVRLTGRGVEGIERLQNGIELGLVGSTPADGPFGLRVYADGDFRFLVSTDESHRTPRNHPIVFDCRDLPKEIRDRYPHYESLCRVDYQLGDGAWLYYSFFLKSLASWREIDAAIRGLILGFRTDQPR